MSSRILLTVLWFLNETFYKKILSTAFKNVDGNYLDMSKFVGLESKKIKFFLNDSYVTMRFMNIIIIYFTFHVFLNSNS